MLEIEWEKVPNWESLFVHRQQDLFQSVHVEDIKLAAQGGEEERVVAQSRLARNPVARNLHRSSTVPSSSSSQSLENLSET